MPAPSGLHAKLLRERAQLSAYFAIPSTSGLPGHVAIYRASDSVRVWSGHRDLVPMPYRYARGLANIIVTN